MMMSLDYEELAVAIIERGIKDLMAVDDLIRRKIKHPKFPCVCFGSTCHSIIDLIAIRNVIISDLKSDYCRSLVNMDMDKVLEMYEEEYLHK